MSGVKRSLDHSHEVPWAKQFYIHYLTKRGDRSHEKQNAGSARRVTRIAGSPFCDGMLTFLARPIFLHINTFVHSAVSTRSRGDIRACANTAVSSWLEKWAQLFSHISARLS